MTAPGQGRVGVGGLQVAEVLHAFVRDEALPGSGIDEGTFWTGVEQILADFTPRNRDLLARRARLQEQLDAWHLAHPGPVRYQADHIRWLRDIGYLVDEPTQHVELTCQNTLVPPTVHPGGGKQGEERRRRVECDRLDLGHGVRRRRDHDRSQPPRPDGGGVRPERVTVVRRRADHRGRLRAGDGGCRGRDQAVSSPRPVCPDWVELPLGDHALAECPRWDVVRQRLSWVDILGGTVAMATWLDGVWVEVEHRAFGRVPTAAEPLPDGALAVAVDGTVCVLQPDGAVTQRVPVSPDFPAVRTNDMTVDGAGR